LNANGNSNLAGAFFREIEVHNSRSSPFWLDHLQWMLDNEPQYTLELFRQKGLEKYLPVNGYHIPLRRSMAECQGAFLEAIVQNHFPLFQQKHAFFKVGPSVKAPWCAISPDDAMTWD